MSQSPPAGARVKCGTGVDVLIALSPRQPPKPVPVTITVPALEGRDQLAATRVLEAVGLHIGEVGRRPSDDPPGTVVSQSPSAGTVVRSGMPVQVWLAVPKPVEVPAVVGRQESEAVSMLRDRRLRVGDIRHRESSKPSGVVLEQAPEAGRQVNADTSVDLWLATPRKLLVPDVRGRDQRRAVEALQLAGLVVGRVREREGSAPRGTVMDQLPAPGSQVGAGTAVSLSIASAGSASLKPDPPPVQPSRPSLVRVPAVVDMPLARAFVLLQNSGLRAGRISETRAKATAATVMAQFPAGGTDVQPGTPVDLVVAASAAAAPPFGAPAPPVPTVAPRDPVQTFITERMQPPRQPFLRRRQCSVMNHPKWFWTSLHPRSHRTIWRRTSVSLLERS